MKSLIVIPARYNSSRLPGKPLKCISHKPMIQWVYEAAKNTTVDKVLVATDHPLIFNTIKLFTPDVKLTGECKTRTHRVIEAIQDEGADIVINLQGDEPFINPKDLDKILENLRQDPNNIYTLLTDIKEEDMWNPNVVKASMKDDNVIRKFTRGWNWTGGGKPYRHIGVYGYSVKILKEICSQPPTQSSNLQKLEQLSWMDKGINIMGIYTKNNSLSIDTEDDLKKAEVYAAKR